MNLQRRNGVQIDKLVVVVIGPDDHFPSPGSERGKLRMTNGKSAPVVQLNGKGTKRTGLPMSPKGVRIHRPSLSRRYSEASAERCERGSERLTAGGTGILNAEGLHPLFLAAMGTRTPSSPADPDEFFGHIGHTEERDGGDAGAPKDRTLRASVDDPRRREQHHGKGYFSPSSKCLPRHGPGPC